MSRDFWVGLLAFPASLLVIVGLLLLARFLLFTTVALTQGNPPQAVRARQAGIVFAAERGRIFASRDSAIIIVRKFDHEAATVAQDALNPKRKLKLGPGYVERQQAP